MDSTSTETMYQKIGGKPAVEAVVDYFYGRILEDERLASFFADQDMAKQRRHQVAFVSMALGGPKEYAGRAMRAAHDKLDLEEEHFLAVAGHLSDALEWGGVAEEDIETIIGVVAGLKDDVLGN